MANSLWERPDSVPFPSVWRRYEGTKKMPTGNIPKFSIEDLTEDYVEEVIEHMSNIFLRDETVCSTSKLCEDPVSLAEIQELWRKYAKQRVALVAFVDEEEGGRRRIAGVNMTGVAYKSEGSTLELFKGEALRKAILLLEYCDNLVDVFKKYNVNEYMTALGLSVGREFRGQGLGLELLKTRSDICRAVGLKLTVTLFTGVASQVQAERAGFELLAEVNYEDYKVDGEVVYPNTKTKSFKLMAMRIVMAASLWERPDYVPFPSVWRRYEGTKMTDGKIPKFSIEDLTEDYVEEVIEHMSNIFLKDETICGASKLSDDPVSLAEIQELWRKYAKQRVALVAFVDEEGGGRRRIAGANMTGVEYKGHGATLEMYKGKPLRNVIQLLEHIEGQVNVFEKYNVNEYMTALGLSVSREFRGQKLGLELLKARSDLGRSVGLKLTVTVFTAMASQIQAERAGFELLVEIDYKDYKVNGEVVYPNTKTKSFKLMALRIQ
uniref:N-acetyltransferase domain-containing protein n=1 Tax=Timema tahoe TaxID=61484 RepID=A0A7R9NYR8_9NEOP|nr:unnamed protein product [Timema tahoe]